MKLVIVGKFKNSKGIVQINKNYHKLYYLILIDTKDTAYHIKINASVYKCATLIKMMWNKIDWYLLLID